MILCVCALGTGSLTVRVRGCSSSALSGRTVTIKQGGVTITTGTTDGSGNVTFTLPTGTYDVETDAPTHYDPASTTGVTVTPSTPATVTFTLSPSSGYRCSCDNCYPGNCTGSAPYVIPPSYPSTITGDDGVASFTMSLISPMIYSIGWEAIVTRTAALGYQDPYEYDSSCQLPGTSSNIDVPVRWRVYCQSGVWYIAVACWDARTTNPGGYPCPANTCVQSPWLAITTYYPSAGQNTNCSPIDGVPFGFFASHTPGTGPLNGSASVILESSSIGGTMQTMPYQVYGTSASFSWTG